MVFPYKTWPWPAALLIACAPPGGPPMGGQAAPSAPSAASASPASASAPGSPASGPAPSASPGASPSASPGSSASAAAAPRADCAEGGSTELVFPPVDAVILSNASTDATGDRGYPDLLTAVRSKSPALRCCHGASRKEAGDGVLTVEFVMGADGKVKSVAHAPAKSDIKDRAMGACVAATLKEITFPASRRGRESTMVLPLSFRSKGGP